MTFKRQSPTIVLQTVVSLTGVYLSVIVAAVLWSVELDANVTPRTLATQGAIIFPVRIAASSLQLDSKRAMNETDASGRSVHRLHKTANVSG